MAGFPPSSFHPRSMHPFFLFSSFLNESSIRFRYHVLKSRLMRPSSGTSRNYNTREIGGILKVSRKRFTCNKQTTKRLVETRTRAHVCHVHTSAGIVQVAKNIKRRGGERASCFRAIKHFHFQFLVGAERRGAVGGQPVADDR